MVWDAGGSSPSWADALNWSDDAAPSAANSYTVSGPGVTVRTPDAKNNTFAGSSLSINGGAVLNLYQTWNGTATTNTQTIPSLSISNSTIRPQSSNGTLNHRLANTVDFSGASKIDMGSGGGYELFMTFSGITGSGSLNLTRSGTGSTRRVSFNGDTSGYSGDLNVLGNSASKQLILLIGNTSGWGTGDLTLGNNGRLQLATAFTSATSKLTLSTVGTTLDLGAGASSLQNLTIGGTAVDSGTYNAAQLTALGLGGTYIGSGNITVLGVIPEPASALLLLLSSVTLLRRKRH